MCDDTPLWLHFLNQVSQRQQLMYCIIDNIKPMCFFGFPVFFLFIFVRGPEIPAQIFKVSLLTGGGALSRSRPKFSCFKFVFFFYRPF